MKAFEQIPVRYTRAGIPLHAGVYGRRTPVGPRGVYVGMTAHGFQYSAQDLPAGNGALTRTGLDSGSVAAEIATRTARADLFRVYAWTLGICVFLTLLHPEVAITLLVAGLIGGWFVRRWDVARRTARVFYDIDSEELVGRLALCNTVGEALARSQCIWHVASEQAVYNRKYHAGASALVGRSSTHASNRAFPGMESNINYWSVPAGPIQLLFLPDQLLVRRGRQWWPLRYAELIAADTTTRFIETGPVPNDTRVVDQTWRFTRKDGGPDLRFNGNHQIPVVLYGELILTSRNGDQLTLQTSNPAAAQAAAAAFRELARIASEALVTPPSSPFRSPDVARPVSTPWAQLAPPRPPPPAPPMNPQAQARAVSAVRAVPSAAPPRLPPPLPVFRQPAMVSEPQPGKPRFVDGREPLTVAGRTIRVPLTYVTERAGYDTDASAIVTTLPVGNAASAMPLPYWPRYSLIDPDQRARYLDWMAGGRVDRSIAVGYVFIFFYGLERRALRDGADADVARLEVTRLLELHGENNSFRRYASDFLAFTQLQDPRAFLAMSAAGVEAQLLPLVASSDSARAAVAAWYHSQQLPLPAEYAAIFVRTMEQAKRGAVVTRAADELLALFRIRYREAFGDGIVLEAAKRPLTIEYRPASATMLGREQTVLLPDVFKKVGQFAKVLRVWNDCVDALRKSATKKGGAKALDAAAWSALPDDLRAELDHPDQDAWDTAVAAAPILASFHLTTMSALAKLTGVPAAEKLTPTQLKRVGQRAADVGYALEPEPRLRTRAIEPGSEVLVWRADAAAIPDAHVHGGVTAMLSLAMTVAMADGVYAPEEDAVISSFLGEMFPLDDPMRARIEAMKQLVVRDPERIGNVAKALRTQRSAADLKKIAAVLVAIAAADGTIAETEEKALKRLYRELGLPAGDFATAITRTGARLERDRAVEVQPAEASARGVPIPRPPETTAPGLRLDQAAIDAIVADTKDVAAILAEVFESGEAEPVSEPEPEAPVSAPTSTPLAPAALPRASEAVTGLAHGLDVRYHAVLDDLLARAKWSPVEIRELGMRHRLMPGAILDTINSWSDEALGNFLIEEADGWNVHRELVEVDS